MSSFGRLFRVTTFGESHCKAVGCIVDGVPPQLALTEADIQTQLSRRRPGQSHLTTQRDEKDRVTILSGTEFGVTLGTPIAMSVPNQDARPGDYSRSNMDNIPRPSHADYTYLMKYGCKASSGGGRSSARETIGRVAAGAVAEKYLKEVYGIEIVAFVSGIGEVTVPDEVRDALLPSVTRADVDAHLVRCPDSTLAEAMAEVIVDCRDKDDSIGGSIICVVRNMPAGVGEPVFDKLEASLAHAMLSIPATKAFEIGSGFQGTKMRGHEHNDLFLIPEAEATDVTANGEAEPPSRRRSQKGGLKTATNYSGGIQGGITNGANIYFRVGFKPAATIGQAQSTTNYEGKETVLEAKGRHDPCVVPRAIPIVEAMTALVLIDALLIQMQRQEATLRLPSQADPSASSMPEQLTRSLDGMLQL